MSFPTLDTAHVKEGQALLTDHYRSKLNIPNLLKCHLLSVQEIEGVFWDIINKFQLPNATGDQLDKLGDLVGEPRGGRNDTDYRYAIRLRIRVHRSEGKAEDVLQITSLLVLEAFQYLEFPLASFLLEIWNLPIDIQTFLSFLRSTRPVGVYGLLHFTVWPDGTDLEWVSTYGGAAGELPLNSVYGGVTAGTFVTCRVI